MREKASEQSRTAVVESPRAKRAGVLLRMLRLARRKPVGAASFIMIMIIVLSAILAPYLRTYDLLDKDPTNRLGSISWEHWFGTDDFGRDFYTQILYGARTTLLVALLTVTAASVVGVSLGVVSGYFGGWVDTLIQRIIEVFMAYPGLVLVLAMVAVFGVGIEKLIIALAVLFAPRMARVIRGSTLSVKEETYVLAAKAMGASHVRIMYRHIFPQLIAVYLILITGLLGAAVAIEASLSFLGLGVPPPNPSWGRFLSGNAAAYAFTGTHLVVIPGLAITLLILSFNMLGDTLRDVFDPRLRGT